MSDRQTSTSPEQNAGQFPDVEHFPTVNYSSSPAYYVPPGVYQPYYAPFFGSYAGYLPAHLLPKARFRQRLLAGFVDFLLYLALCVVTTLAGIVVFIAIWGNRNTQTNSRYGYDGWEGVVLFGIIFFAVVAVIALVTITYLTMAIGRGQTLGGRVAGIRFVKASGERPGYGRGFGRTMLLTISFSFIWFNGYNFPFVFFSSFSHGIYYLVALLPLVALIFLTIALLWPLWDSQKQNLFDKAVGIYAVNVRV